MRYSCDYLTKRTYSIGKCKDSSIVSTVKSLIKKSRRERAESGRPTLADDDEEEEAVQSNGKPTKEKTTKTKPASPLKEHDRSGEPRNESRDECQRLCQCDRRRAEEPSTCGWEGSAILNHGSLITFGCLEFTFSLTDFGVDYGSQL